MRELNSLLKRMMGKRMTRKEKVYLESLRNKVRRGEITVREAHRIWNREILGENRE